MTAIAAGRGGPARRASPRAGPADPLGATVTPAASTSASTPKRATGSTCCCSTRPTTTPRARHRRSTARSHRTGRYWHALVPGLGAGPALRLPRRTGRGRPSAGLRFDADAAPARSVRPGRRRPRRLSPGPAGADGSDASVPMKSVVIDLAPYDWEGDRPLGRPFRDTIIYEAHLPGLHRRPELRASRPSGAAPTPGSSRRSRTSWTSASPPWSCCRSSSSTRRPRPPGLRQLLGLPAGLVLRAARGSTPAAAARRPPSDEFRDLVKALHRAGPRGHPRRRLQPHRRGRRGRADLQLPRPRQRRLLPARPAIGRATPTTPAAATR